MIFCVVPALHIFLHVTRSWVKKCHSMISICTGITANVSYNVYGLCCKDIYWSLHANQLAPSGPSLKLLCSRCKHQYYLCLSSQSKLLVALLTELTSKQQFYLAAVRSNSRDILPFFWFENEFHRWPILTYSTIKPEELDESWVMDNY